MIILIIGSIGYAWFESAKFGDGLWWTIVTMSTVGYGDFYPQTLGGRILAVFIMTTGIGILSMLIASLAELLIEKKLKELRGMKKLKVKNHFIICGWNFRGKDIIDEINSDKKSMSSDIVIIANLKQTPYDIDNVHFVHGEVNTESLKNARIEKAKACIVLSDENLETYARDAKSILTALTVKKNTPSLYTSVEIADQANFEQCKITGADEIIVSGKITTNIIVQSVLDQGIPKFVSELVSNRYGQELYKINLDKNMYGKQFSEILSWYKKNLNILVIGTIDKKGKIHTNPPSDMTLTIDDSLIIIAEERPD